MKDVKMSSFQKKSDPATKSSIFDNALPDFACRCANEALGRGNAVFGIQNLGGDFDQHLMSFLLTVMHSNQQHLHFLIPATLLS